MSVFSNKQGRCELRRTLMLDCAVNCVTASALRRFERLGVVESPANGRIEGQLVDDDCSAACGENCKTVKPFVQRGRSRRRLARQRACRPMSSIADEHGVRGRSVLFGEEYGKSVGAVGICAEVGTPMGVGHGGLIKSAGTSRVRAAAAESLAENESAASTWMTRELKERIEDCATSGLNASAIEVVGEALRVLEQQDGGVASRSKRLCRNAGDAGQLVQVARPRSTDGANQECRAYGARFGARLK